MHLLLSLLLAAHPAKVALMPLGTGEGVTGGVAEALTDAVAWEVRKRGVGLVTQKEMIAVLGLEKQRALLGCANDQCLAELGGALGVDLLLTGSVSKLGQSYLIHLQVVDPAKATTRAQSDRRKKGGSIDDVLDELPAMVDELFGSAIRPPSPVVVTPAHPSTPDTAGATGDLQALASTQSWAELLKRGTDVPPSARAPEWKRLITQAANGVLATPGYAQDPTRAVEFCNATMGTYPHLREDPQFMKSRDDLGLQAFDACFRDRQQASECNRRFKPFVAEDQGNASFQFAAGQLVSRHFSTKWVAVPYFYWAIMGGAAGCAAPEVKAALASAFGMAPSAPEVKMAREVTFGPCWPTFKADTDLMVELTSGEAALKNACGGLLEKGVLQGARLAKCQREGH